MKHTQEELNRAHELSLDQKIEVAESRILEFVHKVGGSKKVYVSFSGGKDSTVLLHIVRNILPNVEAVFSDTGLEFPEIKEFVRSFENVTIVRPKMNFREVIIKYGYPIISKEVADIVYYGKRNHDSARYKKLFGQYGKTDRYDSSKWAFLLDAPFDLNAKCCNEMKKKPFKEYEKINGKFPIIGTLANESLLRRTNWFNNGCNIFTKGHARSMPLSIWTEKDIYDYIERFNIKIAKPYEMGYKRTGCIFCAFGQHLEKKPTRFDLLKETHPNLYEYMMKPIDQGGLGFKEPLEYVEKNLKERKKQKW
jgi:3'-phosphoadenosine 5'-phosphosulfate sulfotransferase (PAPS reductase)/FAD synthetase